jgi:hypothetical protein
VCYNENYWQRQGGWIMKQYSDDAVVNFRSRWSKKLGKVKLTDALDDLMKDKDLKPEDKKQCLKFMASLIDMELQANQLDTLLKMLTHIKKANKEGWEKKGASQGKETDPPSSSDLKLLKIFIGKSVDAYKFRETNDLEKRKKLEILAGELLRRFNLKSSGKFLEVGKMDTVTILIKEADSIINGDKSALTDFTDAIDAKSKEYVTLDAVKIGELLAEINQRITRQRSVTPNQWDKPKG